MKKVIRIIALLLVITTMLGTVPAPVSAEEPVIDENSGWYWPTVSREITSGFARKRTIQGRTDIHQGIDIRAEDGTDVYAARSGWVYDVGENSSLGKYICIRHGTNSNGKYIFSTYQHLSEILVKENTYVNIGAVIAKSGHTGVGTGPHLHFHVFRHNNYKPINVTFPRNETTVWDIYVNVGNTSIYDNYSTLNLSVTKYPVEIQAGSGYGLRGTVTSNFKITRVDGIIYNSAGVNVMSATAYPNATSMDIRYSAINNNLIFNDLRADSYKLKISATDSSGATRDWSQTFVVKSRQPETICVTEAKAPEWLAKGKCFGLRGIISSNYVITSIKGEIIQSGKTVQETWDYPYAKSFNVRYGNINNQLHFNWLKRGEYILKITVTLDTGKTFTSKRIFWIY